MIVLLSCRGLDRIFDCGNGFFLGEMDIFIFNYFRLKLALEKVMKVGIGIVNFG